MSKGIEAHALAGNVEFYMGIDINVKKNVGPGWTLKGNFG